jgi:hypothetical protein
MSLLRCSVRFPGAYLCLGPCGLYRFFRSNYLESEVRDPGRITVEISRLNRSETPETILPGLAGQKRIAPIIFSMMPVFGKCNKYPQISPTESNFYGSDLSG